MKVEDLDHAVPDGQSGLTKLDLPRQLQQTRAAAVRV
jgi:hypothetical protein